MPRSTFHDISAEFHMLAAICQHGADAWSDCDLTGTEDLHGDDNQSLHLCLRDWHEREERPIDWPSLRATAGGLGLAGTIDTPKFAGYFGELKRAPIDPASASGEALKVLKLRTWERLDKKIEQAWRKVNAATGDEDWGDVLAWAEEPILEFAASINAGRNETQLVAAGARERVRHSIANPRQNAGIPSPWAEWNRQIGGGFRRKNLTVVAGRPKSGKSHLVNGCCLHAARSFGIPVLNVDTELGTDEQQFRLLAHLSGIPIDRIENGLVDEAEAAALERACDEIERTPFYHRSVIDEVFEEHVALIRRWATRTVGTDEQGVRRDALVAYDYIQMTDPREFSGNFKEHQILGFQMVALSRLAKRYDLPFLVMCQQSRDGQAAGSDRILWKAASLSYLEKKEETEVSDHGPHNGTLWLKNLAARHGPGSQGRDDDISLIFDGATSHLKEGPTRGKLSTQAPPPPDRFDVDIKDEGIE